MKTKLIIPCASLLAACSFAFALPGMATAQTAPTNAPMSTAGAPSPAGAQGGQCSPQCEKMMAQERAMMPWLIGAGALFGLLALTALALFVVVEVQWIKLNAARLRETS